MSKLPDCNLDVYLHGVSLGYFDMKKEDAEAYCKAQTERTGRLHDWHYFGGRVHIKALDGRSIPADQVLVPMELFKRLLNHIEYDAIGSPSASTASDLAAELRTLLHP